MSRPYAEIPGPEEESDDRESACCKSDDCESACCNCIPCCSICLALICITPAVYIALRRDYNCDPQRLSSLAPPYGGELMPNKFLLKERRSMFQWTKLIDAYDMNSTHIGYFYDMHFLLFMRFGFSDANDEIWFEAKYPSFWARFGVLGDQYYLQRCDVGAGGRHGHVFHIVENIWNRSWWCWSNCAKSFEVKSRGDRGSNAATSIPVASVLFNSTVEWYKSGLLPNARHRWTMAMEEPARTSMIAEANQDFDVQAYGLGSRALSVWHVDVQEPGGAVPNWVIGFMAALDDVEEGDK